MLDSSLNLFLKIKFIFRTRSQCVQSSPTIPNVAMSSSAAASPTHSDSSPTKRIVLDHFNKLMTSCVILRIEDFTLYRVTTAVKKQMPKEFIAGTFCFLTFFSPKSKLKTNASFGKTWRLKKCLQNDVFLYFSFLFVLYSAKIAQPKRKKMPGDFWCSC